MARESIIFGTAVLIFTNFLVKILSLVYRAILVRLIGGEGLGLSEMIMPIYSFMLVLASLGIPLAVSNMVSRDIQRKQTANIIKTGAVLLLINSILVTGVVAAAFPFIKDLIFSDNRVYLGFLVLIPTVVIISLASSIRGYFQGSHQTSYVGKSQVVEQCVRVIFGCILTIYLVQKGYSLTIVLAGISAATLVAEAAGTFYLWWKFRRLKQVPSKTGQYQKPLAGQMLRMGTPVTMSRLLTTFTSSCQAVLIPRALIISGFSFSMAATLYGYFSGVALVVLHLPAIITNALTVPLIPAVAEASAAGNDAVLKSRIHDSMLFTSYTALPLLTLLFYFATPICSILFASPQAGPMLALLCMGGIFLYMQQPVIAILQGLNCFKAIFINLLVSDIIYIGLLFYFYLQGSFTITTAIILFIVNDILLCVTNTAYLKYRTKLKLGIFSILVKPAISSFAGLFAMEIANKYLPFLHGEDILQILLKALIFLAIFVFTFFLCGGENRMLFVRLFRHLKPH